MSIQEIHNGKASNPARKGTTDLYCTCVLSMTADSPTTPVPQEEEIEACRWLRMDDLLAQPLYSAPGSVFRQSLECAFQLAKAAKAGLKQTHPKNPFGQGTSSLLIARL